MSYPNVCIVNLTRVPFSGKVDYAACSIDSFGPLQPGANTDISRGVCLITSIDLAVGYPFEGKIEPYTSSGTSYAQFRIEENPGYPDSSSFKYVIIHGGSNLIQNDLLLIKGGLKESAAFYKIEDGDSSEAIAEALVSEQKQQITNNWPENYPAASFTETGTLLRTLSSENRDNENSCVHGRLEEINSDAGWDLAENDINLFTRELFSTLVKGRFKMKFTKRLNSM